ncbi:MAG: hypothetical protein AB7F35_25475 [Acetobacteraceae bacterium]|uniref:hypothetical protein n=1 Tax=Bradyrhizobium sp. TaxID=376 RepID=UPI003D0B9C4F
MTHPWKQGFRQIPPFIRKALAAISADLVVVVATKKIPITDIKSGVYAHLELLWDGSNIIAKTSVVPPEAGGKASDRNVNGWEITLRDQPKITKTRSWETPNFGDAAIYGTHTHYHTQEVYQRKIFEARHLPITVEVLKQPLDGNIAVIKFAIDCTLDRARDDFDDELLFCLNLLQENTGAVGIYASDATRQEFIGTIALDWEIFPPGTTDEVVLAFLSSRRGKTFKPSGELASRIELFNRLEPVGILRGNGSFGSYVGAQFADDLVVFENLHYGNALYVLYDDWADISKRSRLDLLKGTTKNFDRFPHRDGWEDRFIEHMRMELRKRKGVKGTIKAAAIAS